MTPVKTKAAVEFSVGVKPFADAVALMAQVIGRKSTIPVLTQMLVESRAGGLFVSATDLDVALRVAVPATVSDDFSMLLPIDACKRVLNAWPAREVAVRQVNDEVVELSGGSASAKLPTMRVADWPALPMDGDGTSHGQINGSDLAQIIRASQCATTSEDTRYFLNGIQLTLGRGFMQAVATDGHHMTWCRARRENESDCAVLLAKKALPFLLNLCEHSAVVLHQNKTYWHFSAGATTLTTRRIDANFPAFERVFPKDNDKFCELDRAALLSALETVAALANQRSHAMGVKLAANEMKLSSGNDYEGTMALSLPVSYAGDALELSLNVEYLINLVTATPAPRVRLELKDAMTQVSVKPAGESAVEFHGVVMPMRF